MTLARFLRDGHTHHPEKTALIFAEHAWTYAEVDTLTGRLAANLLAQGLEPGDRVAFHMGNCPELVFGYYGCFKVGAIAVPINARMGPSEIEYFLQHSEARFYIGQPDLYQPVLSIRPHLPPVTPVLSDRRQPVPGHRCVPESVDCLLRNGRIADRGARPGGRHPLHLGDDRTAQRGHTHPRNAALHDWPDGTDGDVS